MLQQGYQCSYYNFFDVGGLMCSHASTYDVLCTCYMQVHNSEELIYFNEFETPAEL